MIKKILNQKKKLKIQKLNKFTIISLPARLDYEKKMKDLFFVHYYERVKELVEDDYVNFIDLNKHSIIKNENENLFCDEVHKTLQGNIIVAGIINKYLKIK